MKSTDNSNAPEFERPKPPLVKAQAALIATIVPYEEPQAAESPQVTTERYRGHVVVEYETAQGRVRAEAFSCEAEQESACATLMAAYIMKPTQRTA